MHADHLHEHVHDAMQEELGHVHEQHKHSGGCCEDPNHHAAEHMVDHGDHPPGCGCAEHADHAHAHSEIDHGGCETGKCGHLHHNEAHRHIDAGHAHDKHTATEHKTQEHSAHDGKGCCAMHHSAAHSHIDKEPADHTKDAIPPRELHEKHQRLDSKSAAVVIEAQQEFKQKRLDYERADIEINTQHTNEVPAKPNIQITKSEINRAKNVEPAQRVTFVAYAEAPERPYDKPAIRTEQFTVAPKAYEIPELRNSALSAELQGVQDTASAATETDSNNYKQEMTQSGADISEGNGYKSNEDTAETAISQPSKITELSDKAIYNPPRYSTELDDYIADEELYPTFVYEEEDLIAAHQSDLPGVYKTFETGAAITMARDRETFAYDGVQNENNLVQTEAATLETDTDTDVQVLPIAEQNMRDLSEGSAENQEQEQAIQQLDDNYTVLLPRPSSDTEPWRLEHLFELRKAGVFRELHSLQAAFPSAKHTDRKGIGRFILAMVRHSGVQSTFLTVTI